eukprot:scaffold99570_cov55-Phaeocystis_antarctica.AAC.4
METSLTTTNARRRPVYLLFSNFPTARSVRLAHRATIALAAARAAAAVAASTLPDAATALALPTAALAQLAAVVAQPTAAVAQTAVAQTAAAVAQPAAAITRSTAAVYSQEAIRAAFALFDRDGDGLLSPDELKTIMCRPVPGGVQRTEAEVDALVRQLDTDGDNKLSMEEMAKGWAELGLAPMITAAAMEKAAAEFERQFAKARAAQQAPTNAAQQFGHQFDLLTPMLVMPFGVFKAQRRIMKSTKVWRDRALAVGSLVEHVVGSGKVAIFVSHTWWDRTFTDATNDPNNSYDKGAPDWQTGIRKKGRKWRVICAGVQRLIKQEGLKEEDVSLWVDWQSIYQDDEVEKLKGVESLIRYATLCQYMLVPTEEAKLVGNAADYPEDLGTVPRPYGSRGWW